jgi:hypothetical protein
MSRGLSRVEQCRSERMAKCSDWMAGIVIMVNPSVRTRCNRYMFFVIDIFDILVIDIIIF